MLLIVSSAICAAAFSNITRPAVPFMDGVLFAWGFFFCPFLTLSPPHFKNQLAFRYKHDSARFGLTCLFAPAKK